MYGKTSPIHLNNSGKEVKEMHYDPTPPVENIFSRVGYLFEYKDMEGFPYSHLQVISKAFTIIKKTGKLREYIKSWNHLPLIQKTWIAFKTHFHEDHQEITKTVELTPKQAGYRQDNFVEDMVSRLSTEFQHQSTPHLKILHHQLQQELQKLYSNLFLRIKN